MVRVGLRSRGAECRPWRASRSQLARASTSATYRPRTRRASERRTNSHESSSPHHSASLLCGMLRELQVVGGLAGIALMTVPWVVFTCWYCNRLSVDTVRCRLQAPRALELAQPEVLGAECLTVLRLLQEVLEPISPDLSRPSRILCFTAPTMCSCLDGMLPCLYSKPEEYIGTWFWTDFIYTWPNHPRSGEPKLTKTDRKVIMILVVFTDVCLFLICSYGLTRFLGDDNPASDMDSMIVSTAAGEVNVTLAHELNATSTIANVSTTSFDMDVQAEATARAQEHIGFLVVCLVTTIVVMVETLVHWLLKLVFGIVQQFKKIYTGLGVVTIAATSLYLVIMAIFIGAVLTEVTCAAFFYNIIVPWVSSFPLGAVLSLVGPYGYLFHNSFGSGKSVADAALAQDSDNRTFENPAVEENE